MRSPLNKVEKALRLAVIDAFVRGGRPTQVNLADAVRRGGVGCSQRQAAIYFTKWGVDGICETQKASNGHAGAAYIFNWSGRPIDAVTLRDIAEPVLSAKNRSEDDAYAMKLRSALRLALAGHRVQQRRGPSCGVRQVDAGTFYALPERAYDAALLTAGKRTAANYRSALRALLRDAGLDDRMAIVFPKLWEDDVWAEARDRYFGSAVGVLTPFMRQRRTYWNHYATVAKALSPRPQGPEDVTIAMVEKICTEFIRGARLYLPNQVKSMLRWVARIHNAGPYAAAVTKRASPGRETVGETPTACWAQTTKPPRTGTGRRFWPSSRTTVLDPRGSTISRGMESSSRFRSLKSNSKKTAIPPRPARWHLDPTTRVKRVLNVRTILFHAPRILGSPAADISVYHVFGAGGRKMLAGLRARWAARYKLGEISSANSDSVESLVLAVGLVAKSLALRVEHAVAGGKQADLPFLGAASLEQQRAAYEATYKSAREQAKTIESARRREASGHGDNSVRDVKRIIENTPAEYWVQVLDESSTAGTVAPQTRREWCSVRARSKGGLVSARILLLSGGHVRLARVHRYADQRDGPCANRSAV